MSVLNKNITLQAISGWLLISLMSSCADWNSAPTIVDQNLGRAAKNMIENQILYPEHGQDDTPSLTLDGQKAQTIIKAYREPASEAIDQSKKGVTFDVRNVGGTGN